MKHFSSFIIKNKISRVLISTIALTSSIFFSFHFLVFTFSYNKYTTAFCETKEESRYEEQPIYRILVTGGENGGKSSAISAIANRLMNMGFQVFIVPDSNTILRNGNGQFTQNMTPEQNVKFYGSQIEIQMALEDSFYDIAKSSGKKSVIIMQKGTLDISAYMPPGIWEVLLDDYGLSLIHLRDKRYDGVFHMVTTAIGSPESFLKKGSHLTIEQATSLDFKIINAWIGHPHLKIIDNSTPFEQKVQRVVNSVCTLVGVPRADATIRKFLVKDVSFYIPIKFEEFDMEQTYLKIEDKDLDGFVFVRRRGQNGVNSYTHSVKRRTGKKVSSIIEKQISGREYSVFLRKMDPEKNIIRKKIKTFIWKNQMFELIEFPDLKITILQTEAENIDSSPILPPFVPLEKEITSDRNYHTYVLSQKKK